MSKRTTMVTYRASPEHVEALKRIGEATDESQADVLHRLVAKEDRAIAKRKAKD